MSGTTPAECEKVSVAANGDRMNHTKIVNDNCVWNADDQTCKTNVNCTLLPRSGVISSIDGSILSPVNNDLTCNTYLADAAGPFESHQTPKANISPGAFQDMCYRQDREYSGQTVDKPASVKTYLETHPTSCP